jgi:hypothetical protein
MIMAVQLIVTALQVIRLTRNVNLSATFASAPDRDAMFLVIGAALTAGCFFAGQSVACKGIYLIFVVAGLVAMRRVADTGKARAILSETLITVVLLMWEEFFRRALIYEITGSVQARALLHEIARPGLGLGLYALFWFIRELLWWRLAALLLAVLAIFGLRSELFAALQAVGVMHRGQRHSHRQKPNYPRFGSRYTELLTPSARLVRLRQPLRSPTRPPLELIQLPPPASEPTSRYFDGHIQCRLPGIANGVPIRGAQQI